MYCNPTKNNLGFVLFCILCNINYIIEFLDKYFVEEIPQKFKYAYLQYYYICDFIEEKDEFLILYMDTIKQSEIILILQSIKKNLKLYSRFTSGIQKKVTVRPRLQIC